MRCVKTCCFPANTHKNRRKTQNSFVPYLTSACPALLLRCPVCALPSVRLRCTPTAATRSGRCIRHRRRSHRSPATAFSLKTCWMLLHKLGPHQLVWPRSDSASRITYTALINDFKIKCFTKSCALILTFL